MITDRCLALPGVILSSVLLIVSALGLGPGPAGAVQPVASPRPGAGDELFCEQPNFEQYVMDAQSGNVQNLTSHPGEDIFSAWSPDGATIAFASGRDCDYEIYTMPADGGEPRRITASWRNDMLPVWSPDGTQLAFVDSGPSNAEVFVMDADGGNRANRSFSRNRELSVTWSPDGRRLAMVREQGPGGETDIVYMEDDGSNPFSVRHPGNDDAPAWSPSIDQMAFLGGREGQYELYLLRAGPGQPIRLTNTAADELAFDWSPDGECIVVVNSDGELVILAMDDPTTPLLSMAVGAAGSVDWSPTGDQLAFTSDIDGNLEIYVVNADGTGLANISNNPAIDRLPEWSPDGSTILFSTDRDQAAAEAAATPLATLFCAEQMQANDATKTMTLEGDCVTDQPIVVGDGWTFDGQGHRVFPINPEGDRFRGGVISFHDAVAHVRNVTIGGAALDSDCDPENQVRGVELVRAGGTITDVTLRDVGPGDSTDCGSDIMVVGRAHEPVAISNVRFADPQAGGIYIRDAEVTVSGVRNVAAGAVRVIVLGRNASGTITGNFVTSINLLEGATAVISDNVIVRDMFGIYIGDPGSHATITGNLVDSTYWSGIVVDNGATAVIADNTIENPLDGGLRIWGDAEIRNNTILMPGKWGIDLRGDGVRGTINGNTIRAAGTDGITIAGVAAADIVDNTVSGSAGIGIAVSAPTSVEASDVTLSGNTVDGSTVGIGVSGTGLSAAIRDNVVADASEQGILIEDGAEARVEGNTLRRFGANERVRTGPIAIVFAAGTAGSAVNNDISLDDDPDLGDGCSVFVSRTAVVISRDNRSFVAGRELPGCEEPATPSEAAATPEPAA